MVLPRRIEFVVVKYAEQINGREGETATLLLRCPLNFSLRVGGFAPRHLSRYALRVETEVVEN